MAPEGNAVRDSLRTGEETAGAGTACADGALALAPSAAGDPGSRLRPRLPLATLLPSSDGCRLASTVARSSGISYRAQPSRYVRFAFPSIAC